MGKKVTFCKIVSPIAATCLGLKKKTIASGNYTARHGNV